MRLRTLALTGLVALIALALIAGPALAAEKKNPMEAWKPKFDPSGAKYKVVVSNVSTPGLIGVRAGFWIRDALWEATKGQMYFDYRPFSQLGGEVEVLNLLQTGAIQGMSVSSVASTNLGPRMGVVNLPFLVNTYEKLDKFIADKEIFEHFLAGMEHQGIIGLDITAYGQYGWATRTPVKSIEDAKKEKFRTAEAAVNQATYKAWGFNPVVMPWPDVPTALKQGVITALDHTPDGLLRLQEVRDRQELHRAELRPGPLHLDLQQEMVRGPAGRSPGHLHPGRPRAVRQGPGPARRSRTRRASPRPRRRGSSSGNCPTPTSPPFKPRPRESMKARPRPSAPSS